MSSWATSLNFSIHEEGYFAQGMRFYFLNFQGPWQLPSAFQWIGCFRNRRVGNERKKWDTAWTFSPSHTIICFPGLSLMTYQNLFWNPKNTGEIFIEWQTGSVEKRLRMVSRGGFFRFTIAHTKGPRGRSLRSSIVSVKTATCSLWNQGKWWLLGWRAEQSTAHRKNLKRLPHFLGWTEAL